MIILPEIIDIEEDPDDNIPFYADMTCRDCGDFLRTPEEGNNERCSRCQHVEDRERQLKERGLEYSDVCHRCDEVLEKKCPRCSSRKCSSGYCAYSGWVIELAEDACDECKTNHELHSTATAWADLNIGQGMNKFKDGRIELYTEGLENAQIISELEAERLLKENGARWVPESFVVRLNF